MKVLEDRLYLLDGSSRVLVHSLDELLARLLYAVFQWIKIDHNLAVIPHPYAVWVQKKSWERKQSPALSHSMFSLFVRQDTNGIWTLYAHGQAF